MAKTYTCELHSAISLKFDKLNQLSGGLECPNLKLLRLVYQLDGLIIARDFFSKMQQLSVLELNNMCIHISPSLQYLTSLLTLSLDYCTLDFKISTIDRLSKLEILSFYGSRLFYFLQEIEELCHLRPLDLRFEKCLHLLPPGVLSGFEDAKRAILGSSLSNIVG